MPDPRFYDRKGPYDVAALARIVGANLTPGSDPLRQIDDIASLGQASARDVVFASGKNNAPALAVSKCGACLISSDLASHAPPESVAIVVANPRKSFAQVAATFYPAPRGAGTPSQSIAPDALIAKDVIIAPGAVIGAGATIGAGTQIGANTVVGPGVQLGAGCSIGANVTLQYCIVGHRVTIHPGVRIGQDGFGYVPTASGLHKIPQLGRVMIGDDVEIGANCTIDRGTLDDTVIGDGCKFDNLVQIGHNVVMGRNCILVAQSGIAGSCTLGDGVIIGGQVGISDHVTIGSGAQIAAQSGVSRDVPAGAILMGYPAKPIRRFWREIAALARLAQKD